MKYISVSEKPIQTIFLFLEVISDLEELWLMVGHFVYLYSFGNPTCCSEVLNSLYKVSTNNGKYRKTNPSSFLWVKVLTGLAIENERKCYSFYIFSTLLQTPWKENHLCNPLPFGNLSFSDPLPLGISVILRGEGVWIFSGTIHCEVHLLTVNCSSEPVLNVKYPQDWFTLSGSGAGPYPPK